MIALVIASTPDAMPTGPALLIAAVFSIVFWRIETRKGKR